MKVLKEGMVIMRDCGHVSISGFTIDMEGEPCDMSRVAAHVFDLAGIIFSQEGQCDSCARKARKENKQ